MWALGYKDEEEYRFHQMFPGFCYKHREALAQIPSHVIPPFCNSCEREKAAKREAEWREYQQAAREWK
jgi:hypothetical protein